MDKNEGALYINSAPENSIVFFKEGGDWVMRITQDCISVNDNVSVDDAAEAVIAAIGRYLNKSKWVGLTDEDMKDTRTHNFNFIDGARWAEKKLRSRNGG